MNWEETLQVSETLVKEFSLPFDQDAADRAAMTNREILTELRRRGVTSMDAEKEFINVLIERYKAEVFKRN